MNRALVPKKYDVIVVGAGLISLLEASHQAALGREVLVLERGHVAGGAWQSVTIGGWVNVENAVHYFLPDRRAESFLRENLKIATSRSRSKFLVRVVPGKPPSVKSFDSWLDKVSILKELWQRSTVAPNGRDSENRISRLIIQSWRLVRDRRWYPAAGSGDLRTRILEIVAANKVLILYGQEVNAITINSEKIVVTVSDQEWVSSELILSHGLRGFCITVDKQESVSLQFPNRGAFRPQALILLEDPSIERLTEYVVAGDDLVKYVHEVSGYAVAPSKSAREVQRILAVALHPDTSLEDRTHERVIERLVSLGIVSNNFSVLHFRTVDAFIPDIDYAAVNNLVTSAAGSLNILATENLARALGDKAERWKKFLKAFE